MLMEDRMSVKESIENKLNAGLQPVHLDVINESHMHNVPAGSESHFKVIAVSEEFQEKNLVARHRRINAILVDELAGGVHALSLETLTPDEWFERGGEVPESPQCLGGSNADK